MADRIGQQVGNYRLTRLLGQGSFAEVYQGEHLFLGTTAAIKVLHAQVTEEQRTSFHREARLLASLKHPHIVPVFDFGLEGQTPYLVMVYAPNGSLRTRHAKGTRLPVSTVVDYVNQVAAALQYAHDRSVVHRDIKPENMLIGEQNEVLLSDFGIALIAHSSRYQSKKDTAGTIAYMSPEQISAQPRPQSDQYSLGIVVYEWLSGTFPFHGSLTEIAVKHSIAPPPPLRRLLPTLSPDVEYVVLTALAKQPEERFPSIRAFAMALEQASRDAFPTQLLSHRRGPSSPVYTSLPTSPAGTPLPLNTTVPPTQLSQPTKLSIMNAIPSAPFAEYRSHVRSPILIPAQKTSKPIVSRRAVLIGAAGITAIAAIGASVFVILQQRPQHPQGPLFTYTKHSGVIFAVAWQPNGQRIASGSGDQTVQVWNASDGGNVVTYRGHTSNVFSVAWSPDGQKIASGSADKTVQVWNASDGSHIFTYQGHSGPVNTVAWSPDGQKIASGSDDNTVQVWNASDGNNVSIYRGHSGAVMGVTWEPSGKRIASGSGDNTVQVWSASDGSQLFTYRKHSGVVLAVAWEPAGQRIASGSIDQTVQVWNANDGSNALTYRGHSDGVNAVAWSPDGVHIVSGSTDKTVQIWNTSDGRNVSTYQGHSDGVSGVTWSPDGRQVVSGSSDTTVRVWQAL